jgi:hypothetical protein
VLTALSPAKVWVGLKNGDAVGLRLDLLAEVFVNATKVGQGQLDNVSAGTSGFNGAILDTMTLSLNPASLNFNDALKIMVSARRTCSGAGHNSGMVTLWYNGKEIDTGLARDAGSRFDATIGGSNSNYYLRTSFALSATAGSSRTFVDRFVDSSAPCPNRPFTTLAPEHHAVGIRDQWYAPDGRPSPRCRAVSQVLRRRVPIKPACRRGRGCRGDGGGAHVRGPIVGSGV